MSYNLLPYQNKILEKLGINIRLARLRRRISHKQVCQRAKISNATLWGIEKGNPKISLGNYAKVLFVLGLGDDLSKIALDDELGRKLQDADIQPKERAPKRKGS